MDNSTAWLQRPGLAYQTAFNFCAAEASRIDGITVLLASDPFYAREISRRLGGEVLIHPTARWNLNDGEINIVLGPEIDWRRVSFCPDVDSLPDSGASAVIWAGPEKANWRKVLSLSGKLVDKNSRLLVLGETDWLRRLLNRNHNQNVAPVTIRFTSLRTLNRELKDAGWTVEKNVGFQGPASVLWGTGSRIPAMFGRDDLVDRCSAAVRRLLVVNGRQANFSSLWLCVATKKS